MRTDEGIVVESKPFKERGRLITIFSRESGLLKLLAIRISKKDSETQAATSLFAFSEYLHEPKEGGLSFLKEAKLLGYHEEMRKELAHIKTASSMAQAILSSQLVGKPAVQLFELFSAYLGAIPMVPGGALFASFMLKILRHEGVFAQRELNFMFAGEDLKLVRRLAEARRFEELNLSITPVFEAKVLELFRRGVNR